MEIRSSASGNVYAVVEFNGAVDFDPGPGVANRTAVGAFDAYVLKLDIYGNY